MPADFPKAGTLPSPEHFPAGGSKKVRPQRCLIGQRHVYTQGSLSPGQNPALALIKLHVAADCPALKLAQISRQGFSTLDARVNSSSPSSILSRCAPSTF